MATAVAEERIVTSQDCFDFVPPECWVGQQIQFWPNGNPESKERPQVGIVVERPTTRKTITVHLMHSGQNKTTVRHVTDPSFILHPNLREHGAWDYLATEKAADEWRASIDERLEKLDQIDAIERRLHSLAVKVGRLAGKAESTETTE